MKLRPYRQWGGPFHVQRWHLDYDVTARRVDNDKQIGAAIDRGRARMNHAGESG